MGTVSVRRCHACNSLTAEWGQCRKCGAFPARLTIRDLPNRFTSTPGNDHVRVTVTFDSRESDD